MDFLSILPVESIEQDKVEKEDGDIHIIRFILGIESSSNENHCDVVIFPSLYLVPTAG